MSAPLLATVRAQSTAVETLHRALAAGRVHHAYLFDGPDGVGKELAALGLAQALVCERRASRAPDACGECRACIRVVPRTADAIPLHPDVVLLARGLYEPATIGRRTPETQDISIDRIRTLVLARAAFPPHEAKAKVFIVRRAEELSVPAANALLKTLEEPGAQTYFILLSASPDTLLPTIRSRAQRVRFGVLPESVITQLLRERQTEPAAAEAIARLSGGSMSTALALGDPEASQERQEFVARALGALDAETPTWQTRSGGAAKKLVKDVVITHLQAIAAALAAEGRAAASASGTRAETAAVRYSLALAAIQQIEGNASVQLAIEAMFIKMRAA